MNGINLKKRLMKKSEMLEEFENFLNSIPDDEFFETMKEKFGAEYEEYDEDEYPPEEECTENEKKLSYLKQKLRQLFCYHKWILITEHNEGLIYMYEKCHNCGKIRRYYRR